MHSYLQRCRMELCQCARMSITRSHTNVHACTGVAWIVVTVHAYTGVAWSRVSVPACTDLAGSCVSVHACMRAAYTLRGAVSMSTHFVLQRRYHAQSAWAQGST